MTEPSPRAVRLFRAWDALRDRPVGRLVRAVRDAVDPAAYALWALATHRSTRRPATFNQKVRYKMLHDRRPILTLFADKVAVRDYVARTIGADYLPEAYQVATEPAELRWDRFPREFACKVSHASGGAILVTESADPAVALPDYTPSGHPRWRVHPDAFDPRRAAAILRRWLETPYGWSGFKREWAYRNVLPRILVEEFLRPPEGGVPPDYKFYVFGGRTRLIELHQGRFERFVVDRYTRDWAYWPFRWVGVDPSGVPAARPEALDEMLFLAEELSAGLDFVRVDLYLVGRRIVFGELTHYPAGGSGRFDPPEVDATLGAFWQLPPADRLRGDADAPP
jgi:hypothetical protein